MSDNPVWWLDLIQNHHTDDLKLARFLLRDLTHYRDGQGYEDGDTKKVLAMITAIRLHQESKP